MKPSLPQGRALPPKFKFTFEAAFSRTLTWKERLQILIGYNLVLALTIYTEHAPGKHHTALDLKTTPLIKS